MSDRSYEQVYEDRMAERLADGKAVRMYRTTRGWQYINNKPQDINRALRQSYVPEDVAVAAGVPIGPCGSNKGYDVTAKPAPAAEAAEEKPKRGPGRPRKLELEGGE